jgi:sec-independent protein translocase protein TatA
MKILGLGMPELIIILVVVLLIFGPKNLPKLGKALGGGVKNLRAGMKEGAAEAEDEEELEELKAEQADAEEMEEAEDASAEADPEAESLEEEAESPFVEEDERQVEPIK